MPRTPRQIRKRFLIAWSLLIAIPGYTIAIFHCPGHDWAQIVSILFHATLLIGALCAIPLGIYYGSQEQKDYWF